MGVDPDVRSITPGATGASTHLASAAGENFTDIVVGKERWYAVTQQGKVYTGPLDGTSTINWPLTNADTAVYTAPRVAWAKHRLWATYGRHVYIVDTTATTGTAVAAKYSHPSTDWSYTDITEGPSCVYLAGWSGTESYIQKITLDTNGSIPELTAGVTTATMPRGEKVQRIEVLAGQFIGIATNRGFRIGVIDGDGDIQYSPLFLQFDEGILGDASALTSWDRFFYVSWRTSDSRAVVYRVDVGQEMQDGSFAAWAPDVQTETAGYFSDLAVLDDGRVVAAFSAGTYPVQAPAAYWYQHKTELVASGEITFGKVRFRTTEPEVYMFLQIEAEPLAGSITVDAVLPGDSTGRVMIYNEQATATWSRRRSPRRWERSGPSGSSSPWLGRRRTPARVR